MKIEKKLKQMNMSNLKKICQKMKVNCTNNKKDNINRLLKPLKRNQYKMFRTRANTWAKKVNIPSDREIQQEIDDDLLKRLKELSIPPPLTEKEKKDFEQRLKKLEEPYKKI